MKRLNKFIISLGVAAILAVGSSATFAKSSASKQRVITGLITNIDRSARIITVKDNKTNETINIQVPVGSYIRTAHQSFAASNFEQLILGMIVRDVAVQ